MQKPQLSRKPFVKPALTEEASLEDVTLISGGISNHGGHGKNKGHGGGNGNKNKNKNKNKPNNQGHGRKN